MRRITYRLTIFFYGNRDERGLALLVSLPQSWGLRSWCQRVSGVCRIAETAAMASQAQFPISLPPFSKQSHTCPASINRIQHRLKKSQYPAEGSLWCTDSTYLLRSSATMLRQ